MGFEDRPYYRDGGGQTTNPLMWLWTGSVPLFTIFGIRVRMHASLVLIIVLVLLFGFGGQGNVQARVQSMGVLFVIILLHELGHCFGARMTGGSADDILMTPLGGLAMAMSRHNPWSRFVTVAAGPAVNVVLCILCGAGLFYTIGLWPIGPFSFGRALSHSLTPGWFQISSYLFWIYTTSYWLLLFNLLPVFPLDGGQLLQSVLWKPMGYYKSMLLAVNIGLGGAVLMAMVGVATFGTMMGGLLLMFIAVSCFINCLNMRRLLLAEGPWGFQEEEDGIYSAAYEPLTPKRKAPSRWSQRRAVKAAAAEKAEQELIDRILQKVHDTGMNSLTRGERNALKRATERQRQRDAARAKHA